jgi:hypothetical protein
LVRVGVGVGFADVVALAADEADDEADDDDEFAEVAGFSALEQPAIRAALSAMAMTGRIRPNTMPR